MMHENKSVPRNITYEQAYSFALELFGYDKDKTTAWWLSRQKVLNDKSPYEMVKEGQGRRLMRIMRQCI